MKVIIVVEIGVGTHRIEAFNKEQNEELIQHNQEMKKEKRLRAYTRAKHYKSQV